MAKHDFIKGGYGHGTLQCKHCGCTEREASIVLGMECDKAPQEIEPLKLFRVLNQSGVYPIGFAAIVLAENKFMAIILAQQTIADHPELYPAPDLDVEEIPQAAACHILHDGNY